MEKGTSFPAPAFCSFVSSPFTAQGSIKIICVVVWDGTIPSLSCPEETQKNLISLTCSELPFAQPLGGELGHSSRPGLKDVPFPYPAPSEPFHPHRTHIVLPVWAFPHLKWVLQHRHCHILLNFLKSCCLCSP